MPRPKVWGDFEEDEGFAAKDDAGDDLVEFTCPYNCGKPIRMKARNVIKNKCTVRVHVAEVALGKQSLFAISRRGGFSYYCPSPRFPAARPARLPSSCAPSTLLLSPPSSQAPRRFAASPSTPFVQVVSALEDARSPRRHAS